MISLPNECYYQIFINLWNNYKTLFSCAFVNRQWCRIIIPILWSEPGSHFNDKRLIKTLLLMLNANEQTLLIPFEIDLPSHPKPLFEYTSYITSVTYDLYDGIRYLFVKDELETAVKYSLIAMLLRTGKNLKYFFIDEIICDQFIFERLYESTTITSVDLYLTNRISYNFSIAIDSLIMILYKNSTLTTLGLASIRIGSKKMKTLLEALYKNTVLNSLCLSYKRISTEEEKMFAEFLCKNTTLTSLSLCGGDDICWTDYDDIESDYGIALAGALCKNNTLKFLNLQSNYFEPKVGKAFADSLCKNTALTSLNLGYNYLKTEGGKALANALYENFTLTSLDLGNNNIGSEGGKALADALCKNTTLTSLDLSYNYIGSEGAKALANALCKNTSLNSLNLHRNDICPEGGKALANALCKNFTLKYLNLENNNLGLEGGKVIADSLCKNSTLTFLNLRFNDIDFKIKSNNQRIEILP